MANTFLTPDIIAREALMVLRNNAVMPCLVYRDYSSDFVGKVGDTITVRKPATFKANEFVGSIDVQNATESGVNVKLDKHLDVSFSVTAKDMSLDIKDFSKQLLIPAMQAFADKIDGYLIAQAKTASTTNKVVQAAGVTKADVIAAREILTKNAAPLTDRYFIYNSETESNLLNADNDLFISAEKVGDSGTALREASLGRKFGMDFYVDQNMDAAGIKAVAIHKNALALVTRVLDKPLGNQNCSIVNYDGFGLRVVYGYDMTTKTDTVSIDMLCGVATLDKKLVSQIAGA